MHLLAVIDVLYIFPHACDMRYVRGWLIPNASEYRRGVIVVRLQDRLVSLDLNEKPSSTAVCSIGLFDQFQLEEEISSEPPSVIRSVVPSREDDIAVHYK